MSLAVLAQGTLIKLQSSVSPTTYNTIPESIKINAPNVKFDLLDVTSHDSPNGFKEYIPGLSDGENCTDEINFVPTNAIHTQIRTDAYARNLRGFKVIFPVPTAASPGTGSEIDFNAYIVNFPAVADAGQVLRNTMTAKVTGQPTWV